MSASNFSILHISDLHAGSHGREQWRRVRVLGDSWLKNLDELSIDRGIDIICLTGDIAQSGQSSEYEMASKFLEGTLRHLGLSKDRLFVVPGNHDIDRTIARVAWEKLRDNAHRAIPIDLARWISGGHPPWGFEDIWRDEVLSRQSAFRSWLLQLGLEHLIPEKSPHGKLGYRAGLRLPGQMFDINIIGLDSAWLSGDDNDAGRLRFTDEQIGQLASDKGEPLHGFRCALMHHPVTDLADGAECRQLLAEYIDLLLRGHLHKTEPEQWFDPNRALRTFATGCLFEGTLADHYINSCSLIRVTCDAEGHPKEYQLRFRGFSRNSGNWFDDNSLYKGTVNGRLIIRLDKEEPFAQPHENRQAAVKEHSITPRLVSPDDSDLGSQVIPSGINQSTPRVSEEILAATDSAQNRNIKPVASVLTGWEKIVARFTGKRIAVLGAEGSGKTTLIHFLTHGVQNEPTYSYRRTLADPFPMFSIKSEELRLAIKPGYDIAGDRMAYGMWKSLIQSANVLLYLVDASLISAESKQTIHRLHEDTEFICRCLENRKEKPPKVILIGTHADRITGENSTNFLTQYDLFCSNKNISSAISKIGMSAPTMLILGDFNTRDSAGRLIYELLSKIAKFNT